MKAVRIHSYGKPEVLVYEDVEQPIPGQGQILVRIRAAGINPVDWKIRSGKMEQMIHLPLPVALGFDLAGIVEAVGDGVSDFKIGQEVYGTTGKGIGSYAEFALAGPDSLAIKPSTLSFEEAAAVPVTALTAWQALFECASLESGQRVLIHGASGGVGSFAVQLALWKGATVAGTASAKHQQDLKDFGVQEVIDYENEAFEQKVSPVDVVLDTVGGKTIEKSWQVLKPGGILVSTVESPKPPAERRAAMVSEHPDANQLKELAKLLDAGVLRVKVGQVFKLDEACTAHELGESGHAPGKMILRVS